MAKISLYLDDRKVSRTGEYQIYYLIRHNNSSAAIGSNIKVKQNQWDSATQKIKNHPQRAALNHLLEERRYQYERAIIDELLICNAHTVKAVELKEAAIGRTIQKAEKRITFYDWYLKFMNTKSGRTYDIYKQTLIAIEKYDRNIKKYTFDDITKAWLIDFDLYLSKKNAVNTRSIHFRNIRAVFNDAIDDDITTAYPFRKFHIKTEDTIKRSLTIEQLRMLWYADIQDFEQKYLDFFKLSFLLIGINSVDIFGIKEIINGRVEYRRSKTNKLYSIKVEPEALEIIEKYKGKDRLINMFDTYSSYVFFRNRTNLALQNIAKRNRLPKVSTYWARHTWATIAAELDIPKETISEALGHQFGNRVTSIYINFDKRKVDEANRKVIDYLLLK